MVRKTAEDRFYLGVLAGVLSNIVVNVFHYVSYSLNFARYLSWHIAASAYFPVDKVSSVPALVAGMFTDYSVAACLGVAVSYLLHFTGREHHLIKGLLVTSLAWLFVFGMVLRTGVARIDPTDPGTNLTNLMGHVLLGLLISIFIVRLERNRQSGAAPS